MRESPTQDGVKEIQLDSWREFLNKDIMDRFATGPAYMYRGQTNYDWPLVSSLDRHKFRYPKRKNLTSVSLPRVGPIPQLTFVAAGGSGVCGCRA